MPVVTAGITRASLIMPPENRHRAKALLGGLIKHSSVAELELLAHTRSDQTVMESVSRKLKHFKSLKRLQLRFTVSHTPRKGNLLCSSFRGYQHLGAWGLESLTVDAPGLEQSTLDVSEHIWASTIQHLHLHQPIRDASGSAFFSVHLDQHCRLCIWIRAAANISISIITRTS